MEATMQVRQLKRLVQEFGQCEKELSSNIRRLDAVCESCHDQLIKKKLDSQGSFLKKQSSLCKDLAAVLEQAGYLYETAEEEIIQAAETDARRYEETLRAVSLPDMAQIPVTLK